MTMEDKINREDLERMTEFYLCNSMNGPTTQERLDYADKALECSPDNHRIRAYVADIYFSDSNDFLAYSHLIKALTSCGLEEMIEDDNQDNTKKEKLKKDKDKIINTIGSIYQRLINAKEKTAKMIKSSEEIIELYESESKQESNLKDKQSLFQSETISKGYVALSINLGDHYFSINDYEKAVSFYQKPLNSENEAALNGFEKDTCEIIEARVAICYHHLGNYPKLGKLLQKLDVVPKQSNNEFWKLLKKVSKKKLFRKPQKVMK